MWQNHQTHCSLKDIDKGLTHIPKLFLQEADPHQMKTVDHKNIDPRLESEGWWCWLPITSWPTSEKNVHELTTPCSLNHYYKSSHYPLQGRTHRLKGISPLCPPLPGKAIKLFFSASPKTLSLRFNPAPVYRGWISATIWLHIGDPPSPQRCEKKTIWKPHPFRVATPVLTPLHNPPSFVLLVVVVYYYYTLVVIIVGEWP